MYDPHYCYYTLYGCRDVLRVRWVLVLCMTLTTVIIHSTGVGCIKCQGGISFVYDPHYRYHTLITKVFCKLSNIF